MKYAIAIAILTLSFTSCQFSDTVKDQGPKAVAFGQCSSPALLQCYTEVYGPLATLEEVKLLSEAQ
jgi:hypothetical protein